jgi:phage gp29-like protein
MGEIARRDNCDYFSALTYLPDPDIVLRKKGGDVRIYEEMQSDPHIGGCLGRRKAGTMIKNWSLDMNNSSKSIFAEVERTLDRLNVFSIINEILDAPWYGFQPLEITWQEVNGLIQPVAVTGKPSRWFCFSAKNELLLRTKLKLSGEMLPDRKFLLAQHDATYENPYGRKIASLVFWYFIFKKKGLKWWVTFLEKFGIPYLIGKTPPGSPVEKNKDLCSKLAAMVHAAVAVIPDDSSVEILSGKLSSASTSTNTGNSASHEELLNYCDRAFTKAILGHSGAADSTPGRLGGENIADQATQDIIDTDTKLVCGVLNDLIVWFVQINYGDQARYPKFILKNIENSINLARAERDKTLAETGIKFTKQYLQRHYRFKDDEFEIVNNSNKNSGATLSDKNAGSCLTPPLKIGKHIFKEGAEFFS